MSKKSADTLNETIAALQKSRGAMPIPAPVKAGEEGFVSPEGASVVAGISNAPIKIAIDLLDDSPSQYRLTYPIEELDALGATLLQGQVEPIRARLKADGRYELITGHRRKRAAKSVGMETLDAIVVAVDDKRAAVELILANESQESVGDFERATGYRFLVNMGMRQIDIADVLGVSKAIISKRLRFFDLPVPVLDALELYPRAFSHNIVPALCDILNESPDMVLDIAEGVKKVAMGDWSSQSFLTTLRQRQRRGTAATVKGEVLAIADKDSRPVLTMQGKPNGRVEIQLAKGIDQEAFLKNLTEMLRDAAGKDEFLPA